MISSGQAIDSADVAEHYDELDWAYREIWGEHVHHGLWWSGDELPGLAARQLVIHVAERAGISTGSEVCDVGCGYGGTARLLVRERRAAVTAITLSRAQYDYARASSDGEAAPSYLLGDWLDNGLSAARFDAVLAIESTEHMADLAACFSEAHRVLRPGGRFVVCAWLAGEHPHRWERRHLLEPICREGRLCRMGSAGEYRSLLKGAGFEIERFEDLSARVRRTWSICIRAVLARTLTERRYVTYLLCSGNSNRSFTLSLLRIWLAYRTGAMRYGVFTARKRTGGNTGARRSVEEGRRSFGRRPPRQEAADLVPLRQRIETGLLAVTHDLGVLVDLEDQGLRTSLGRRTL